MESDSAIRSRKRNRSKSDEVNGTFTRSRSQIYLHRHRSGYARADSLRKRSFIESVRSEGTASSLIIKNGQMEEARVSVKDLRARRVFSPTTTTTITDDDDDDDDVSNGGEFGIDDVNIEVEGVDTDVIKSGEVVGGDDDFDVCKKIDGDNNDVNDDVMKGGEFGSDDFSKGVESVRDDVSNDLEVVNDDVMKGDEIVECEQRKGDGEKSSMGLVANEVCNMNGSASKSQSSVTSLRARKKVFKSPSSFSYRRLLPYLKDIGNDDSSNFEIVETTFPEEVQKLGNKASSMVKNREIGAASVYSKLTDDTFNIASAEQYVNKVNPELVRTVEGSVAVQKSLEDVQNDTVEECEQMTPPDSDIYSKSKIEILDVPVKPTSKRVLKPCSRMKILHTPTSFSHRRLLPFLTSVAEDGTFKGNQSSKVEKDREQNQPPSTLSLLHQNVSLDQSKTISTSGQSDTANENSDSPTSTLIPVETPFDSIQTITLASSDNLLDDHGPDMGCSGSTSQLELNLPAEAVEFDSSIKVEQSPPKSNLSCVEEATPKAIETSSNICTEQSIDTNNDFMEFRNSYSVDNQTAVSESGQQSLFQFAPLVTPGSNGGHSRNGILKRTPRGCRGICNCLNCTSFRLHAERSFEFSRNQMHDAEEVALELINDLTSLRNILERTASDSSSLATDKGKQIKEACEQALYKEEVARARLTQMNEYLSIHCRSMNLSRPKVTFANKIEEKRISKNVHWKKSV